MVALGGDSIDTIFKVVLCIQGLPLVAQTVKRLPTMQETQIQSLSQEDPLEEGMATHSSILASRISMGRAARWATVHKVAKSRTQLM